MRLGQVFDAAGVGRETDVRLLLDAAQPEACRLGGDPEASRKLRARRKDCARMRDGRLRLGCDADDAAPGSFINSTQLDSVHLPLRRGLQNAFPKRSDLAPSTRHNRLRPWRLRSFFKPHIQTSFTYWSPLIATRHRLGCGR